MSSGTTDLGTVSGIGPSGLTNDPHPNGHSNGNGNGNGFDSTPLWPPDTFDKTLPATLLMLFLRAAYARQLELETSLEQAGGKSAQDAWELCNRRSGCLDAFHAHVQDEPGDGLWGWGAAADAAKVAILCEVKSWIARLLITPKRIANEPTPILVHGSSTTGNMGAWDAAFKEAWAELGREKALIRTIPLRWKVRKHEQRELAAKSNGIENRCPPIMMLSLRTDTFAVAAEPRVVAVAPGGYGSLFEIGGCLAAGQLKDLLLTWFSGCQQPPPLVFLDYFMDEAMVAASLQQRFADKDDCFAKGKLSLEAFTQLAASLGLTLADFGVQPGWFWDGLLLQLRRMFLGGAVRQEHMQHVIFLRVGGPGGNDIPENAPRIGPAVRYAATPKEAAEIFVDIWDKAESPTKRNASRTF